MSFRTNILVLAAAASVAGVANAGLLTMTADKNASGTDAWSSLNGYSMVLSIDSSDLDTAGSASSFTLQNWSFEAFDQSSTKVFSATGSNAQFTASGSGPQQALISLSTANITVNTLNPMADYIAFTYDFTQSTSLNTAITLSASSPAGELTLGTTSTSNGAGDLVGSYAVPSPSAIALIGLGGLISRRRKA